MKECLMHLFYFMEEESEFVSKGSIVICFYWRILWTQSKNTGTNSFFKEYPHSQKKDIICLQFI